MRAQMLRFAALAVLPVLVVLSCVALSRVSGGLAVSNLSKVKASLDRYEKRGVLKSSLFDDKPNYTWPRVSFQFGSDTSIDQFVAKADAAAAVKGGPKALSLPLLAFTNQVGLLFTKGTPFEGKFQVNLPPKEDSISLYVLDSDPDGIARHFDNNCEYIGYYNAIICDAGLFKTYFSMIDRISSTYDIVTVNRVTKKVVPIEGEQLDLVKNVIKQSILVWVLAHEIGHAVLHKDVVLRDSSTLHFDLQYNKYEEQADAFVAKGLIDDNPLATSYWLGTGEFVHQEFRRIYREDARKEQGQIPGIDSRNFVLENKIVVSYSRYNVPMLLRAVRIINQILEIAPEIDRTGFYKVVAGNITLVRASPDRTGFWLMFGAVGLLACVVIVVLFRNERPAAR